MNKNRQAEICHYLVPSPPSDQFSDPPRQSRGLLVIFLCSSRIKLNQGQKIFQICKNFKIDLFRKNCNFIENFSTFWKFITFLEFFLTFLEFFKLFWKIFHFLEIFPLFGNFSTFWKIFNFLENFQLFRIFSTFWIFFNFLDFFQLFVIS